MAGESSPESHPGADGLGDERELVEQARHHRGAFAQLYRLHVNEVYAFAYRRCGSKEVAEEATSATFERALRSIATFEWRDAGIRPWLLRIASNEVATIYRRQARPNSDRGQLALRSLTAEVDTGSGDDSSIRQAVLHRAINELSSRQRDAVTLRYLCGMSADEAAAELGWTKAVLAVTLHRALAALRDAVSDAGRQGETS